MATWKNVTPGQIINPLRRAEVGITNGTNKAGDGCPDAPQEFYVTVKESAEAWGQLMMLQVLGQASDSHSAFADLTLYVVANLRGGIQTVDRIRHGSGGLVLRGTAHHWSRMNFITASPTWSSAAFISVIRLP